MSSSDHVNKTYKVVLQNGAKGVFKPDTEDRAGRRGMSGLGAEREAAASDIADAVGLKHMVPQTVVREISGGSLSHEKGSFQKFVEHADEASHTTASRRFDGEHDEKLAGAFDYLIANSDRHWGNWMIDDHEHLHLIDNGLCLPSTHDHAMCNAFILSHLESKNARVPDEVKEWGRHWPNIENIMRSHGFGNDNIRCAHERLDALVKNAGEKFSRLRDFGPTTWNARFYKGDTYQVQGLFHTGETNVSN